MVACEGYVDECLRDWETDFFGELAGQIFVRGHLDRLGRGNQQQDTFGFEQTLKWSQNFQLRIDQGDNDVDVIISADLEQCFRVMVFLDPGQDRRTIAISKRRRTGTVVGTEDFTSGAKCFLEVLDEVASSAYGCQ